MDHLTMQTQMDIYLNFHGSNFSVFFFFVFFFMAKFHVFSMRICFCFIIANCEIVSPCVKIKDKLKMFQHQTSKTMKTLCSIK